MKQLRKVEYITPETPARVPYAEQQAAGIVRQQRTAFVAPDPKPLVPVRVEVLPPTAQDMTPVLASQTIQHVNTSAVDRAKGFSLSTVPLSAALGVVALLVAVASERVPLVSVGALVILFGTFAAVWSIAYAWHMSASPDGVGLWAVLLHYKLLRHEQRARLERMRKGTDL